MNSGGKATEEKPPMPIGKAIGGLLLVYLLIGGSAIWTIRRSCLLLRDDCGYRGLLEWVLSDRLTLIGSAIMLSVLFFITWHFIVLARQGKLGLPQDEPEPRFNVNGFLVAVIAYTLYSCVAFAILISAANELEPFDIDRFDSFVWKSFFAVKGSAVLLLILWHLNEDFVRPVSTLVLLLLFGATFGSLSWFVLETI